MGVTGLSATAVTAINATINAIADIPNSWLSLVVTIVVLAIIVMIMIKAFSGATPNRG